MIQKRLTEEEFNQSNKQGFYLMRLRRNISILYYDSILNIPSLGMKLKDGVLIDPEGNQIRVSHASFKELMRWLEKGAGMLRSTSERKPFDDGFSERLIRIWDEGNLYF